MIPASNIGGPATLIGDPPDIIIASRGNLCSTTSLLHLALFVVVAFGVFITLARWLFRTWSSYDPMRAESVMRIDERRAIRDPALLQRSLVILALPSLLRLRLRSSATTPSADLRVSPGEREPEKPTRRPRPAVFE